MSETTNYGGVDLTRHPALKEAFRIACLIEACGASPELTKASSAAFDFIRTLDSCLNRLEGERDAARLIARKRTEVIEEARKILEPLQDCDPAIRKWLREWLG